MVATVGTIITSVLILVNSTTSGMFIYDKFIAKAERAPVEHRVMASEVLRSEFKKISELSVYSCDYKAKETLETKNAKWFKHEIPNTSNIVDVYVPGTISYGIDVNRIYFAEKPDGTIIVTVPSPYVTSHVIHQEKAEVTLIRSKKVTNMQTSMGEFYLNFFKDINKVKEKYERLAREEMLEDTVIKAAEEALRAFTEKVIGEDHPIVFVVK